MQPVDLTGKRILLTGASSGIGAAATKQFGLHRAVVVAVARRKDLLDAVADRITGDGGTAMSLPCDLSDMEAIDALVEDVEKRIGGIDILINNAGRSIRRPLAESLERWHDVERTMVLNYYAPLRLIRGLAPGMLERGDGHIINVATWGVLSEASPLFSVYNASKAALSAVSRIIETEWGSQGVHSTTLYYPLVATPMIAPTKAYDGLPALTAAEAADGHRRPHPTGADRASGCRRRQRAGQHRSPLGQCTHAAPQRTAQPLNRVPACRPSAAGVPLRDRHRAMEILASRMLLRPADYQRSLSFYRDQIGLAIAREYGAGTVFFAGQSLLELAGYGEPDHSRGPFPGALWLQVRDLEATQTELVSRGVSIAREPRREPWGLHEMHVTDPDGITLIFVEVPEGHPLRTDTRA